MEARSGRPREGVGGHRPVGLPQVRRSRARQGNSVFAKPTNWQEAIVITGKHLAPAMMRLYRLALRIKAHLVKQASMAEGFGKADVHEKMLLDKVRCETYREAIRRCVRSGDVVVDLGAGTGLLSFFAVQSGAARVYALEMSRIADVLEEVSRANGLQDRIRVMRGNSKEITLPEKCDVLVTETLSDLGFDNENMIDYVNDVRRRMLKPGARVVPESCRVLFVPFQSDEFGLGGLPTQLYGLDYSALRVARYARKEPILVRGNGKAMIELAEPLQSWNLDLRHDLHVPRATTLDFEVLRDGRLDGVLGWFEATLASGVQLRNGPRDPEGNWAQAFFPTVKQPLVRKGQLLRFHVEPRLVAGGCEWTFSVEIETQIPGSGTRGPASWGRIG